MLRNILGTLGILVIGFVLVVGLVYLELRAIIGIIRIEGTQHVPLHQEAVQVRTRVEHLRNSVTQGLLAVREEDLAAIRADVELCLGQLQHSIGWMSSPQFEAVQSAPLTDGRLPSSLGIQPQTMRPAAGLAAAENIGRLLHEIHADTARLSAAALRSLGNAQEQLRSGTSPTAERPPAPARAEYESFQIHAAHLADKLGVLTRSAEHEMALGRQVLGERSDRAARLSLLIGSSTLFLAISGAVWMGIRTGRRTAGVPQDGVETSGDSNRVADRGDVAGGVPLAAAPTSRGMLLADPLGTASGQRDSSKPASPIEPGGKTF